MKLIIANFFTFALLLSAHSQNYIADPAFSNDFAGRVGHSNSNLTNPPGAGFMQASKCIIQEGSYVYVAGKTTDDQYIYGGYILNKKNATNGSNPLLIKLNYGLLTTGTVNTDDIWVNSLLSDASLNRLYVVGKTTATNKGIILCFDLTNLQLVTAFNTNGILLMETGASVSDLILKDATSLFVVRTLADDIKLSEVSTSGSVGLTMTLGATGKAYKSSRIKRYPGIFNRYYITGYVNQSTTNSPAIWGVDYTPGATKGAVGSLDLICHNALELSTEGPGEFLDLCFPYNTLTSKYDIVCVGRTVAGNVDGATGIYIKYKGNTTMGAIFNLAIDNTYKNQTTLPGNGYCSNITDPTNMTVFSGCEVIGNQVAIVGSYKIGSNMPHDANVAFINAAGTAISSKYIAPHAAAPNTSNVVHYPGRLSVNAANEIFVVGCDFGLSAFKLKPN